MIRRNLKLLSFILLPITHLLIPPVSLILSLITLMPWFLFLSFIGYPIFISVSDIIYWPANNISDIRLNIRYNLLVFRYRFKYQISFSGYPISFIGPENNILDIRLPYNYVVRPFQSSLEGTQQPSEE